MSILVTGGAGFIASNLCRRLLELGHEVVAVDNLATASGANLTSLGRTPCFRFIEHDIVHPLQGRLLDQLSKVNTIYHLACPTGVPNLIALAEEMLLTCSEGTRNVLELACRNDARLLFASTSEVYGDPLVFPQTEEYSGNVDPTGVRSPYEEGKRFSESLVSMYIRKYGLDARITRIFNTYGPGMSPRDTRVVPMFLRQALGEEPLTVQGNGEHTRTFCYVDDLIDGLILVMEKGASGQVYNLGSGTEVSIRELATLIIQLTGARSRIQFVPRPLHDHQRRLPSLEKVAKLGWQPTTPLKLGLRKTIEHEKRRLFGT